MLTLAESEVAEQRVAKRQKKEKKFAWKRSRHALLKGFMRDSGGLQHFLNPPVVKPNPDWKGATKNDTNR